jgi:hypothetical protein
MLRRLRCQIDDREERAEPLVLTPPRLPAAAHAGAAEGRARAGRIALAGHRLNAGAHLVEVRLARTAAPPPAGAMRGGLVIERDAHLIERGLVDFASLTSPRFLTSPRLRGEVAARSAAGEGALPRF